MMVIGDPSRTASNVDFVLRGDGHVRKEVRFIFECPVRCVTRLRMVLSVDMEYAYPWSTVRGVSAVARFEVLALSGGASPAKRVPLSARHTHTARHKYIQRWTRA